MNHACIFTMKMNKEIENEKVVISSLVRKSPPIARIFSLGRTRERSRKRELKLSNFLQLGLA
jgi:hypothetical protein